MEDYVIGIRANIEEANLSSIRDLNTIDKRISVLLLSDGLDFNSEAYSKLENISYESRAAEERWLKIMKLMSHAFLNKLVDDQIVPLEIELTLKVPKAT